MIESAPAILPNLTRMLRLEGFEAVDGNATRVAQLARRNRSEFYSLLHRDDLDPALFKTPRE